MNNYENNTIQKKIDEYFSSLEPDYQYDSDGNILTDKSGIPVLTERQPATLSSLAYAIGCSSRQEFEKIRKRRVTKNIIERALLRLEAYTERMLFDKSASAGAKFLLESDFNRQTDSESQSGGIVILADVNKEGDN